MDSQAITDSVLVDGLSVRYLKVFGLWGIINDYRTTKRISTSMKLILAAMFVFNIPYTMCQVVAFFSIKVDIQKATLLSLHAVGSGQLCARFVIFLIRLESQCRLYSLIRKDFLQSIPGHKRISTIKIFRAVSKRTNILCLLSLMVNGSISVWWIGSPTISVEYIQHRTGSIGVVTGGRKKILSGWYPVPMSESPYYELIMVWEIILHLWNATYLTVFASMYFQPLMCLYAQFLVLGNHISTLKVSNSETNIANSKDSEISKELYVILKDHQKLIRFTDELKNVYNPLVTIVLAMGIGILVVTIFQFLFGGTTDPIFLIKFLQFSAFQGVEVYMFCFGSSYIEEASSNLSQAIYNSEWFKADLKYRRTALMLMIRAQKGMTLTAIRMYPVNAATMMGILQFTYTMSTLLKRMTE